MGSVEVSDLTLMLGETSWSNNFIIYQRSSNLLVSQMDDYRAELFLQNSVSNLGVFSAFRPQVGQHVMLLFSSCFMMVDLGKRTTMDVELLE